MDEAALSERVATLEERTTPKPKTIFDQLKEWGGILSLLIALGYTFPLGLWDRFMISPQEAEQRKINAARSVVLQSAQLVADFGRTISAIQDPRLRTMVSRAYNTQLQILMASNNDLIAKYAGRLEPQEILVLAYDYQMVADIDKAIAFYQMALNMSQDNYLRSEILRLKGQALFIPSPRQDIAGARAAFLEAARHARGAQSLAGVGSWISTLSYWASAELLAGDWKCGQQLMTEAVAALDSNGALLGDDGASMPQMLRFQIAKSVKRAGQPELGCAGAELVGPRAPLQ
jgi:tetratricopeptide (TPR) repeat protein